jgi:hypothetical protein
MRRRAHALAAMLAALLAARCRADGAPAAVPHEAPSQQDSAQRADKRYEEMLGRMQAAVEEVAQLYGNPLFLEVFTNDEEKASQLKERLRAASTGEEIRREVKDLQDRRDALLNDIALRQREAARISDRLVRQRAALEALAGAMDQARKAVEDTAR